MGVAQPDLVEIEALGGLNLSAMVQGRYEDEKARHQLSSRACLHGEAAPERKHTLLGRYCLVWLVPHRSSQALPVLSHWPSICQAIGEKHFGPKKGVLLVP